MGIAAYNRGSQTIANQISRDFPKKNKAFEIMDRINALTKFKHVLKNEKVLPIKKVTIAFCKHTEKWSIIEPIEIFDNYQSLEDLICSFDIYLTGYDEILNYWYAESIN